MTYGDVMYPIMLPTIAVKSEILNTRLGKQDGPHTTDCLRAF